MRPRWTGYRMGHIRSTYQAETAWAPRYDGHELRQVRAAALQAAADAARADAEAAVARRDGDLERAGRHDQLAASARSALEWCQERAGLDEHLMEDRKEWERRTAGPRHLAVQADSELRRRHPGEYIEPLASAEPEAAPDQLPEVAGAEDRARHAEAVAGQRAAFRQKLEERLGLRHADRASRPTGSSAPGIGHPFLAVTSPGRGSRPPSRA